MLIALITLLFLLNRVGINVPYIDNINYALKMKLAENRFNTYKSLYNNLNKPVQIVSPQIIPPRKPYMVKITYPKTIKPILQNLKI